MSIGVCGIPGKLLDPLEVEFLELLNVAVRNPLRFFVRSVVYNG